MDFVISILEQGLIYGILALGVYITYKILDFPDLTVDGSFPLGGAITAHFLTGGMNPYLTLLAGICGRSSSWYLYWTDPCEMPCPRSVIWYYYDDSAVDD